ncbi:MAG: 1-acyl-sn-glycerol-3-phosphate acyltransferase [Spirochaetaceae bacterium]|nr:1-acyl-sn-glycerol-3-phosphate acyltransferase [Spirochaetaceae bacterium]
MSSIITTLVIIIILICFVWLDFVLKVFYALAPRGVAYKLGLRYEDKAIHLIFSLLGTYRGLRINFESKLETPLPSRFLIVSNHQSLFDIPVLMDVLPKGVKARFVAKKSLSRGIPLISLILRRLGHSLVRQNGDSFHAIESIGQMARRCRAEGTVPVIFPEGHRSHTGALGTFHSAGYRKILEVDALPILVVGIDGGWKYAKLKDFFKGFGDEPYTVRFIKLLPKPENKQQARESLIVSRQLIEDALKDIREKTKAV